MVTIFQYVCLTVRYFLSRHTVVSAAKKAKKDVWHTSVLFTSTVKLPNSASHISKTIKPISTFCHTYTLAT